MERQQNSSSQYTPQRVTNSPQNRGNFSQYNNQARSMPTRPVNSGFQNFNRPQQTSASPSYQNFSAYNQFQNRQPDYRNIGPTYQSYSRRDQQTLSTLSVQRQITAGPSFQQNVYDSGQPFQPRFGNNYQAFNRSSYQPGYQPGYPFYQAASNQGPYTQKAYQAFVESEEFFEPQFEQDFNYDPNSFHDDYYQDSLSENKNSDSYSDFQDFGTAKPEVNFVDSVPLFKHSCQLYQQTFESRNKLFRHLKQKCWKKTTTTSEAYFMEAHPTEAEAYFSEKESPSRIIESAIWALSSQGLRTAFRGYQHIKIDTRFLSEAKNHEVCLDSKCLITLKDRALLTAGIPDFEKRIQK